MRTILVLLALLVALPATAQMPKMERGPAHERLDALLGHWQEEGMIYIDGEKIETRNRMHVSWLPGGVWLRMDMEIPDSPLGAMFGTWHVAYDEAAEEYVRTYVDSQSTITLPSRGTWVHEKVLRFEGSFDWFGTTIHLREEINFADADEFRMRGSMGTDPEHLEPNHDGIWRRVASPGDSDVQRVLKEDELAGGIRNHACEDRPLAQAIEEYVTALDGIDFDGCPADFAWAFARHRDAWEASIPFFEEFGELRGELHDLFERIRGTSDEARRGLEAVEATVWGTWAQVEAASQP